jgi:hypothetical protein
MTQGNPFQELWVQLPDGQAMCALVNGDVGWLMYLPKNGDSGFSSRNPDYRGPAAAKIEYRLEHGGQRDEYPASWAIPVAKVHAALKHFRETASLPGFVAWHDDSKD